MMFIGLAEPFAPSRVTSFSRCMFQEKPGTMSIGPAWTAQPKAIQALSEL